MKWFNRKPKAQSVLDDLRSAIDANPGQWQPLPEGIALTRDAFLLYDVVGGPLDAVWIRKKLNA